MSFPTRQRAFDATVLDAILFKAYIECGFGLIDWPQRDPSIPP